MKTIILLWGLPASGKTTYANKQCPPRSKTVKIVDCDRIWKKNGKVSEIAQDTIEYLERFDCVIIDGLITTSK